MLYDSGTDVEQVDLNVFKIGPVEFQEDVQDGERFVRLLGNFLAKFRIAEVQTGTDDQNPFCFPGKQFRRGTRIRAVEI